MKSRKYPTLQEALDDLVTKGTLTYWGWEGQTEGYYVYSLQIGGLKYHLAIFKDGTVKIRE